MIGKTMLVASALALGSASAVAEMEQNSGFYMGTTAGIYTLDINDIDFDANAPALRVLGGYQFNRYFSVEGSYTFLMKASEDILGAEVDVDGGALEASARGSFPLNDSMELYGRLGFTAYDMNVDVNAFGFSGSADEKDEDFTWAVGGKLGLTDRLSVIAEYQWVNVSDADLGLITAGMTYAF